MSSQSSEEEMAATSEQPSEEISEEEEEDEETGQDPGECSDAPSEADSCEIEMRLHDAIMCGDDDEAHDILYEERADVNYIHGRETAFTRCMISDDVGIIADMILHWPDFDPNQRNLAGKTPLIAACERGSLHFVEELIKMGALIDAQDDLGRTASMAAAAGDHSSILHHLMRYGARLNIVDIEGFTAMYHACAALSVESVRILICAGCPLVSTVYELSTLTVAVKGVQYGQGILRTRIREMLEICQMLIDAGCPLEHRDKDGRTALFHAVAEGEVHGLCMLVDNNADMNAVDKLGWTPLVFALMLEPAAYDMARHLVLYGAECQQMFNFREPGVGAKWRKPNVNGKHEVLKKLRAASSIYRDPKKKNMGNCTQDFNSFEGCSFENSDENPPHHGSQVYSEQSTSFQGNQFQSNEEIINDSRDPENADGITRDESGLSLENQLLSQALKEMVKSEKFEKVIDKLAHQNKIVTLISQIGQFPIGSPDHTPPKPIDNRKPKRHNRRQTMKDLAKEKSDQVSNQNSNPDSDQSFEKDFKGFSENALPRSAHRSHLSQVRVATEAKRSLTAEELETKIDEMMEQTTGENRSCTTTDQSTPDQSTPENASSLDPSGDDQGTKEVIPKKKKTKKKKKKRMAETNVLHTEEPNNPPRSNGIVKLDAAITDDLNIESKERVLKFAQVEEYIIVRRKKTKIIYKTPLAFLIDYPPMGNDVYQFQERCHLMNVLKAATFPTLGGMSFPPIAGFSSYPEFRDPYRAVEREIVDFITSLVPCPLRHLCKLRIRDILRKSKPTIIGPSSMLTKISLLPIQQSDQTFLRLGLESDRLAEMNLLHAMIMDGDDERLEELLNQGYDVNFALKGNSPLSLALLVKNLEAFKIIAAHSDARIGDGLINGFGDTPLHFAARHGVIDAIDTIIEKGGNIEARNKLLVTPLYYAVYNGHFDVASHLIQRGASVFDQEKMGMPLIHLAVASGRADVVAMMLKEGVFPDIRDRNGNTPLHVACSQGSVYLKMKVVLPALYDSKEEAEADLKRPGKLSPKYHEPFKYRMIAHCLLGKGASVLSKNRLEATPYSEALALDIEEDRDAMMEVINTYCIVVDKVDKGYRSQVMISLS